jgi:hypothetical protein
METTKNEMSPYAKQFFDKLSKYLDNKFYFYGSIQRLDYFPEYSDIDADLFTDNEQSTILKIQNFLGNQKNDFKKFIYKLHKSNRLVQGYKIKYADKTHNFKTEIAIYNEKYKNDVLLEHNLKTQLPFFVSILIVTLKFFYYSLKIIPTDLYKYLKRIVLNYMVEGRDAEFVILDI